MTNKSITKNIDLSQIDFNDKSGVDALSEKLFAQMKEENKTLAEVIGLDETFLEQSYAIAYTHYNAGQYKEALTIFEFLIHLSTKTYKYLLGAGACIYHMEDYETAAIFFAGAMTAEPKNPYPAYYLAECLLKSSQTEDAIVALDYTIELTAQHKQYTALGKRCELLRKNLTK